MARHDRTDVDIARDELMSQIHRCGVLKASVEQQDQWLDDTMEYLAERYADLTEAQLQELREIGRRFCKPVIAHGRDSAEVGAGERRDDGQMAGAA